MEWNERNQIQNTVDCPRCLAGKGFSCVTNGLYDYPHPERLENMYRMSLLILHEQFSPNTVGYYLISNRLTRCLTRSKHSESCCRYITAEADPIDEERCREIFGKDADRAIRDIKMFRYPDQYIAKYPVFAHGIIRCFSRRNPKLQIEHSPSVPQH